MPLAIFCKMNNKVFQQELGSDVQKTTKENTGVTNEAVTKDRSKGMETVKVFFTDTTLHGARFMFAESLLRRCLWTLTLVVSLAFCYYQAYGTLKHYFEWPFNTRITSKSTLKNGLPFPAVTLCNFNPQNIHRIIHFQNASNNKEEIKRLKDASKVLTLSKGVLTDGFLKRYSDFFNGEKMERYWKLHSHQIEDMLLPNAPPTFVSCLFDGLVCGAENFTSFESSSFGQCFTFNSGQNGRALLNATVAGKNSGLKLRLNIQRDGYIDNPKKPYVGITVLVHDNYNFPFMDEYGFAVEPGAQTFCAIKMKKITNLPEPYATNCTQRKLKMFRSGNSFVYSKPACLMQCRNAYVLSKCQCTMREFHAKAPVCAPNVSLLCAIPVLEEFSSSKEGHQCEQDCPQPCHHVEYETSLSYAGLQKNFFVDYLSSLFNNSSKTSIPPFLHQTYEPFLNTAKSDRHEYLDNIVSLDIYFKDLNYDELEQVPMYEFWGLSASLGGNFGLFLGISALTVCEFLDYGVRKIYHKICSERKGKIQNSGIPD